LARILFGKRAAWQVVEIVVSLMYSRLHELFGEPPLERYLTTDKALGRIAREDRALCESLLEEIPRQAFCFGKRAVRQVAGIDSPYVEPPSDKAWASSLWSDNRQPTKPGRVSATDKAWDT
jgi:hypothetical protein